MTRPTTRSLRSSWSLTDNERRWRCRERGLTKSYPKASYHKKRPPRQAESLWLCRLRSDSGTPKERPIDPKPRSYCVGTLKGVLGLLKRSSISQIAPALTLCFGEILQGN